MPRSSSCIALTIAALALASVAPLVFAEGPTPSDTTKAVVVATTNIYNAAVAGQDRTLTLSFDLSNRTGAQPQVRYFVELRAHTEKGSGAVADQHTYPDTLSLREGETKHVQVAYAVPASVPTGGYDVWVKAANGSGLLLALANAGTVSLTSDSSFPSIVPGSCSLSVAGSEVTYTPEQGVDIAPSETLTATCSVTNSGASQTVMPHFVVRYRSSVGDIVSETTDTNSRTTLAKGTQKITVTIPTITKPQAYEVLLSLTDEAGARSNDVPLHLVIQGESATIQNIILDKDRYAAGDTAQVSFYWTASADTFTDSRIGTGSVLVAPSVSLRITSGTGANCVEPTTRQLAGQASTQTFTLPVTAPCENPTAHVSLASQSGVLDTKDLAVESAPVPAVVPEQDSPVVPDLVVKVVVALSALAALAAFALFLRRQHAVPPAAPTMLLVALLGASLLGVGEARADTFTVPSDDVGFVFVKSKQCPDYSTDSVTFHFDWPHADNNTMGGNVYNNAFCATLSSAERTLLPSLGTPACAIGQQDFVACVELQEKLSALRSYSSPDFNRSASYNDLYLLSIRYSTDPHKVWGVGGGVYSGEYAGTLASVGSPATYTVSLNKPIESAYAPGESILVTATTHVGTCGNIGGNWGSLTARGQSADGSDDWKLLNWTEDDEVWTRSLFTAPNTPGSYDIDFFGFSWTRHIVGVTYGEHSLPYIVAIPHMCTGNIPNSVPCLQDNTDLAENTPKTLVTTCSTPEGSAPKCEVTCAPGFERQGTACVAVPPPPPGSPTALMQFIDSEGNANPAGRVDPMQPRTWKWESTNAQVASARVVMSECDNPDYDSPSSNWTPWNATQGLKPGSTALAGEQTATPGATRYGCKVDFFYTATNTTSNVAATSQGTIRFASQLPNTPGVQLTADRPTVPSGDRPKLSWTSENVTSCTASGGWSDTKPVQGVNQEQSPITAATTYRITCTGTGGSAESAATVNVAAVSATPALVVCPSSSQVGVGEQVQLRAWYKADDDDGTMTCSQISGASEVTGTAVWTTTSSNVSLPGTKGLVRGESPTTGLGAPVLAQYTTGGTTLGARGYVQVQAAGICGSAAGGTYSDEPTSNLCQSGTVTGGVYLDPVTDRYYWLCGTRQCSADHMSGDPQ